MMRVDLYGVRAHSQWHWKMTLDYGVDESMGFGLSKVTGVIRFKPELSVGQAWHLAARLNALCKVEASGYSKRVRREFIIGCKELGMKRQLISRVQMVYSPIICNKASTSSRAPLNKRVLDQLVRILAGRSLLSEELLGLLEASGLGQWKEEWKSYVQAGVCQGLLKLAPGMHADIRRTWLGGGSISVSCQRCGTSGKRRLAHDTAISGNVPPETAAGEGKRGINWTFCRACGGYCPYCEECLTMGRIRHCSVLIRGRGYSAGTGEGAEIEDAQAAAKDLTRWGLSPAQTSAAAAGLDFLEKTAPAGNWEEGAGSMAHSRFLIWAVTGAGKTEMIFPLVAYELAHGRRVLLATPRRDVVLELKPRLAKAFPERSVVALYGGSEDRWAQGELMLATTHQLMRFHHAFDLVILDELDAFPYHGSPTLQFAARQACRPGGRYVFLSATPPVLLQKEAAGGKLPHVRVPVRYHRHPLPVPRRLATPSLAKMVRQGLLPRKLLQALLVSRNRGAQIFVFVPKISLVQPLARLLKKAFPQAAVGGTSSQDEARAEKVTDFRGKAIDILVTTTILERGVTVPKTDVFILDADAPLFDEASLVQMAGRAGRSKDDPAGNVYFASREWTGSQAGAVRQIKKMNRIAREKGYLALPPKQKS